MKFVNGDTSFSLRLPSSWAYLVLYPRPELWRAYNRFEHKGPYSRLLVKHLRGQWITPTKLYGALKEAEGFLLEPPSEILRDVQHYTAQAAHCDHAAHPVVHEIRKLLLPLGDDLSVFLHGSMATGDYTAFSDVDDLVIIHRRAWASYGRFRHTGRLLQRAARIFQRIDPLQHHGHWVFLDFDMACLDQSTMPLVVLGKAVRVVGPPEIQADIRNGPIGFGRVLWSIVQDVRRGAAALERRSINLYGLKSLVSSISLLPALVFQVRGEMLDKKTAIVEGSGRVFSDQAHMAIRWATKIRASWKDCPGYGWIYWMRYLNRFLPCRRIMQEEIARRFSPSLGAERVPFLGREIIAAMFQLSNECAHCLTEVDYGSRSKP